MFHIPHTLESTQNNASYECWSAVQCETNESYVRLICSCLTSANSPDNIWNHWLSFDCSNCFNFDGYYWILTSIQQYIDSQCIINPSITFYNYSMILLVGTLGR